MNIFGINSTTIQFLIPLAEGSVADPGCLSRISFSYSGNLSIFNFKYFYPPKIWFLSSRTYDPGCSSRLRILVFFLPIPDPGVKKALDPGSATMAERRMVCPIKVTHRSLSAPRKVNLKIGLIPGDDLRIFIHSHGNS
jgi:hypothetical protein